ncbi:hypothetical protein [Gloeothece verrucosa]|uniref:Uncharacterized protein n=1 Tax=Gloeothece verrucosa (strain PCC 7822) TaxID=497965 RepID=E0U5D4_GLOV7|nr:hypothetical protein [Gloeothece verrucosa]ADN13524.1 conserved hypothetical protein [Gloeothece verrucosa PCC 7822]
MFQIAQSPTLYLMSLILPTGCKCTIVKNVTYRIVCPDFATALRVWNRRMRCIYPLLQSGDVVEVMGEGFYEISNPLP